VNAAAGFIHGLAFTAGLVALVVVAVGVALDVPALLLGGFIGCLLALGVHEWMVPYRDFREAPERLREDGEWLWPTR